MSTSNRSRRRRAKVANSAAAAATTDAGSSSGRYARHAAALNGGGAASSSHGLSGSSRRTSGGGGGGIGGSARVKNSANGVRSGGSGGSGSGSTSTTRSPLVRGAAAAPRVAVSAPFFSLMPQATSTLVPPRDLSPRGAAIKSSLSFIDQRERALAHANSANTRADQISSTNNGSVSVKSAFPAATTLAAAHASLVADIARATAQRANTDEARHAAAEAKKVALLHAHDHQCIIPATNNDANGDGAAAAAAAATGGSGVLHLPHDQFYVGVDGGGTKTVVVILDAHLRVRGAAIGACSNQNSVGVERARRALRDVICRALQTIYCVKCDVGEMSMSHSNNNNNNNKNNNNNVNNNANDFTTIERTDAAIQIELEDLLLYSPQPSPRQTVRGALETKAICLSMSGVDRPSDEERVKEWISDLFSTEETKIIVLNDAAAALASGTDGAKCERVSGWGPMLGDRGSGFDIGQRVLEAVARAADGRGPSTVLTQLVLQYLKMKKADELIDWAYAEKFRNDWDRVANLSKFAFEGYHKNDLASKRIVLQAAKDLFSDFRWLIRKLNRQGELKRLSTRHEAPTAVAARQRSVCAAAHSVALESIELDLVLQGGNLTHENSPLTKELIALIHAEFPNIKIHINRSVAAAGAALIGLRHAEKGENSATSL